jgi:hypothetical protein
MPTAREATTYLADLLRRERHAMAEFLVALAQFHRERRWLELGHASLFAFLRRELGLSAGAAQYRKTAAELMQAYPAVEAQLRAPEVDGSAAATPSLPATPATPPSTERPRIKPLDAERARVNMTVSRRLLAKLAAARDALSHSHPGASEEEILEVGLDLILQRQGRARGCATRARSRLGQSLSFDASRPKPPLRRRNTGPQ